jgi:hypothetical protein
MTPEQRRRQRQRLSEQMLRKVYESVDGRAHDGLADFHGLAAAGGLDRGTSEDIRVHLWRAGQLEPFGSSGLVELTEAGRDTVEGAAPLSPTIGSTAIFNGPVGAIQTGAGAIANVVQNILDDEHD